MKITDSKRKINLFCLALFFIFGVAASAVAGETTQEFWPEVDSWLRLSHDWRLSMFIPISKNLETYYREGNLILQADYAWGKTRHLYIRRLIDEHRAREMNSILIRAGYLGARSLDDHGEAYKEEMIFLELHMRTPLTGNILVSHRLRPELRWIGDNNAFSTRWRYRLMVEKEYRVESISFVPYVNVEPYYDSRYSTVNRVRLIGGTSMGWSSYYALEVNITYQYDSRSSVTNLYALNVILHLFFSVVDP
jgi:hypothetical protein